MEKQIFSSIISAVAPSGNVHGPLLRYMTASLLNNSNLKFPFWIFPVYDQWEFRLLVTLSHVSVFLEYLLSIWFVVKLCWIASLFSGTLCDWFTNSDLYLIINSTCSERTFITYCLSYTSSTVVCFTGFLLRTSVSSRLFLRCVGWPYQSVLMEMTIKLTSHCIFCWIGFIQLLAFVSFSFSFSFRSSIYYRMLSNYLSDSPLHSYSTNELYLRWLFWCFINPLRILVNICFILRKSFSSSFT